MVFIMLHSVPSRQYSPFFRFKTILVLFIGVFGISTAAIWVRYCTRLSGDSSLGFNVFLAASRLLFSSILLFPAWRGFSVERSDKKPLYYALGAGFCLSGHFVTWFLSLAYTSIAASTTIVTTTPLWISLFLWLFFKEKISRKTLLGMGIAGVGGFLIALDSGGFSPSEHPIKGAFLALMGSWLYGLYFILGREAQGQGLSMRHYIVLSYTASALFLLPCPYFFQSSYFSHPPAIYLYILGMALFAQVLGQTCLNISLHWFSPLVITLAVMLEPVFSSLLAYPCFGELPSGFLIASSVILLSGVVLATWGSRSPQQPPQPSL
jgi:drug/metabolite transporter (DMT)-like permease